MTPSPLFKGDVGTNPEALGFVPYHGNNSVWSAPLSKQQKLTPFCALETEAPGQAAAQSASTAPPHPLGSGKGTLLPRLRPTLPATTPADATAQARQTALGARGLEVQGSEPDAWNRAGSISSSPGELSRGDLPTPRGCPTPPLPRPSTSSAGTPEHQLQPPRPQQPPRSPQSSAPVPWRPSPPTSPRGASTYIRDHSEAP